MYYKKKIIHSSQTKTNNTKGFVLITVLLFVLLANLLIIQSYESLASDIQLAKQIKQLS